MRLPPRALAVVLRLTAGGILLLLLQLAIPQPIAADYLVCWTDCSPVRMEYRDGRYVFVEECWPVCEYYPDPTEDPPPPEDPGGGGSPPPPPSVSVTEADITNDVVRVSLGNVSSANLVLRAYRDDGGSYELYNGAINGGETAYSFQANNLSSGRYQTVSASVSASSGSAENSRGVDFTVRGRWLHTRYATIYESTCAGDPRTTYLLDSAASCSFFSIATSGRFVPETWENGSGVTNFWGAVQLPWGCMGSAGSGENHFKQVSQIEGSCGQAVDDNTLAQGSAPQTRPAQCGKWVLTIGVGMKKVTDRCPDCWNGGAEGHLDNYTSEVLGACSKGATSLGTYQTIFMPW